MGDEIYEDPLGEGTRTLLWAVEEDVRNEVSERVTEQRVADSLIEEK